MERLYGFEPVVDMVGWNHAQMVALEFFVDCLDCEVDMDFAWGKVLTVQGVDVRLVNFCTRHLYEVDWCVDFHFDKRDGGGLYEFKAGDPWLLLEQLLKLLKGAFEPVIFWHVHEIIKNGVINSNINVTVLNGDTRGTWSKEFDGYFPHTQHELYSLISDDSPLIKFIGLFVNQVTVLLNVILKLAINLACEVNFRVNYFSFDLMGLL